VSVQKGASVPDFMVIKSADCTSEQESDITVSLIYNGGATVTLLLDAIGALMAGTDADVETAQSYVGNGLDQVVLASDEPLVFWPGEDLLHVLWGAQSLLNPATAAAYADPPGVDPDWGFPSDCTAGTS
jgi:hypothetical protein